MPHSLLRAFVRFSTIAPAAFASAALAFQQAPAPTTFEFPQYPALSPDGALMVFSAAGDLWAASPAGGVAERLTSHPALERRSAFSPDGSMLAFESDREGGRNLFIMNLVKGAGGISSGPIRRVTFSDRQFNLAGWTPDGSALLAWANLEPAAYRGTRMYRVPIDGSPVTRLTDAFGSTPRMTADGKTVIFVRDRPEFTRPRYHGASASDIWRLSTADGAFTRMTKDPASDGDPFVTPDGRTIFVSSRDGTCNIYSLPAGAVDDAGVVQLTSFKPGGPGDAGLTIGHGVRDLAVSNSGNTAVFIVWDTMYRLDLTKPGAQPQPFATTATADSAELGFQRLNIGKEVNDQALSPDGKTLAVIARGEIFVRSTEEGHPTRRVTATSGRERSLAWSPDNRVLWFTGDESGTSQIYYATVALSKEDLLSKAEKDEAAAEDTKKEDARNDAKKKDDTKKDAAPAESDADKKGDDKAAPKDGKDAKDTKKKPDFGKRWAESLKYEVHKLDTSSVPAGKNDGVLGQELRSPNPSPDGKQLIFTRGLGDLLVMDLRSKQTRVLLEGWNEPGVQWAPDSRHIVFDREDEDFNSDIWLMDIQPGEGGALAAPVNITRHPDNDGMPRLTADGKVLYFISERGRENDQTQVYYVNLDKKLDGLRPYELEDYFKKAGEAAKKRKPIEPVLWDQPEEPAKPEAKPEDKADAKPADADAKADKAEPAKDEPKDAPRKEAKKAPKPLKFDLDDAYLRIRRLTNVPGSVEDLAITPGGDRVFYSGEGDPERSLFSVSFKGDDRKTLQAGAVSDVASSLTGDKVFFIRSGAVSATTPTGGKADSYPIDAPVVIDIAAQQRQKFLEVARLLGNGFYHPTLKGLNWAGLTKRYLEIAAKTRNNDEFDRVAMMLLGELDGSHLGVTAPPGGSGGAGPIGTGYLGINTAPVATGARVTLVLPEGPAERETSRLNEGDIITSVDGKSAAGVELITLMAGRNGKETLLEVAGADGKARNVLITPTSSTDDTDLRYKAEIRARARKVDELSGGKLGYLHIRGMSEPSVRDFERDLFAAADGKLGLIIDVRDNGGGSTADILLSSLTAPRHAYTANRGVDPTKVKKDAYPRDRRLIYGYTRPITLLINENSFSNAEIFAHAIKTIKRGTLVGTATYGAVISTGAATLIDGTSVRTPFRGWYLPDGADMENNGAKPDLDVPQTPQDESAGRDAQLEAAVKELLGRAKAP